MKMCFIRFVCSIVFFSMFASAQAASSTDLSELLSSVKSMQANFTQTIYDNRGKPTQRSYGRMAMQRPGKFRWEVTKPIPQLIIANDKKLWIYDPDLRQVTVRSLHVEAGEAPALLLSHDNTVLDKDFTVKSLERNRPGWSWYEVMPKKKDSMFESIQLGFVEKQIHEMRLTDNLGHTTLIQYKNIKTNMNLSASLFTFKATSKMDVIDETRKR